MKELNEKDEILLEDLMKLTQEQKMLYLVPLLEHYYDKSLIKITSQYITVLYDGPICLIAHLDCVQEDKKDYQFIYDRKRGIASSIRGLGYDDTAGIALIIKLLQQGYRFPIIFPCNEECGMSGATQFCNDYPALPFPHLKYFMELDRMGANDLVTYSYANPKFDEYITSFGYFQKDYGTCSDISVLSPFYKMPACNLSVGYYAEHTQNEVLLINEWYNVFDAICVLLDNRDTCPSFDYVYDAMEGWDWRSSFKDPLYSYCDECGTIEHPEDLIDAIDEQGEMITLCPKCAEKVATLCVLCNTPFIPTAPEQEICPFCKYEMGEQYKKVFDF